MNILSYRKMPIRVTMEHEYFCVMWLNTMPSNSGISIKMSSWEIVVLQKLNYKHHYWVLFGEYFEVFEDMENKNDMMSHTQ